MAKTHFGKLMEAWCHPNGKPFSLIMWPDTTIACIFSCITKQKVKKNYKVFLGAAILYMARRFETGYF